MRDMDAIKYSLLFAAVAALLTWAVCRWLYRRKLNARLLQITHLRDDRRQLDGQLEEAKKQIGTLKIALAAQASKPVAAPAVATPVPSPAPVRSVRASYLEIPAGDASEGPWLPAHGFADTQPFEHSGA